jgi:hypothetical protein
MNFQSQQYEFVFLLERAASGRSAIDSAPLAARQKQP